MPFRRLWLDGDYAWVGTRRLQCLVDALVHTDAGSLLEELAVRHDW